MKTRSVVIIVASVAVLVAVLLSFFFLNRKGGNKYQWYASLAHDSEQPYGTKFIRRILESSHEGKFDLNERKAVHKLLDSIRFEDGNTDYVLIGQAIYLDTEDVSSMMRFLENGNDVFIATMEPPTELLNVIYDNPCDEPFLYSYELDTGVNANFYHPALRRDRDYEFNYRFGAEDFPYFWRSIAGESFCETGVRIAPLGYQTNDKVNFARISFGSGHLYLHTNPLMFTNYYLTNDDKVEYVSKVFSHLTGERMIWDEVSKIPFKDMRNPYDSPLYYIMQQPSLKYAWWLLIGGALLYVLFASKRTQRVIPVLENKTNTSLEFLHVISSLHYQNSNHGDMARKKMKYFLYFIRARYGINTQALTSDVIKRLAEKSKVPAADIQDIHDRYKVIEHYSMSDDDPDRLVGLYHAIEKFYKNCK